MAARDLGHEISGRRRDDDTFAFPRQADMPDIELGSGIEQVSEGRRASQRADGQGRHEFGSPAREDGPQFAIALLEPPDEIKALIGGNPAGNNQQDTRARKVAAAVCLLRGDRIEKIIRRHRAAGSNADAPGQLHRRQGMAVLQAAHGGLRGFNPNRKFAGRSAAILEP